ncbi:flagellar hook-basal body complex protein FliE [Poseidonocella sp. HB161398]|uniref:flagellar hook-basal body complex protein FliE n=1 Tax=Poseidonocella sp. HB161398 TaxID=2320855 RepID=UPI001109AA12|nr:flagellar hook-basal body complex protein FliE [Poseidonocella sp. HB161398]
MDLTSTLAAGGYAGARGISEPGGSAGPSIREGLASFAQDFARTLGAADMAAQDAMLGNADPQSMVEALAQAQLAVETAVTIRDKVVEAYQEIMRMQI